MAELMLVNPRTRKSRTKTAGAKKTSARKHNPTDAEKAAARKRRRKLLNKTAHVKGYYPNPKKHRTKRKHNPLGGSTMSAQLKTAFMGSLGGLAVDVVAGKLIPKLPASLQGGYMGKVVKVGLAFGLGALAQKTSMLKGATAAALVEGALTVEMYDLVRNVAKTAMPNLALGEYVPTGMYLPVSGDDGIDFLSGATSDRLLSGTGDRTRSDATYLSEYVYDGLDDGLGESEIDGADDLDGFEQDFSGALDIHDGVFAGAEYVEYPSPYNI